MVNGQPVIAAPWQEVGDWLPLLLLRVADAGCNLTPLACAGRPPPAPSGEARACEAKQVFLGHSVARVGDCDECPAHLNGLVRVAWGSGFWGGVVRPVWPGAQGFGVVW